MTPFAPLLAHGSGWDEALVVLLPVVLFAVILIAANRKARRLEAEEAAGGETEASPSGEVGATANLTADDAPTTGV